MAKDRSTRPGHGEADPASIAGGPVGVVLAGGESRRMGRDKALLDFAGSSLVARAASLLGGLCDEVVVADRGRRYLDGPPSVADGPGRGPAAGILGAAAARPGLPLLVLAGDLPWVPAALLRHLLRLAPGSDAVAPRHDRGPEPLVALYGIQAVALLARRVEEGRFGIHPLLEHGALTVRWVEGGELRAFGNPARIFANLNTPADLSAVSAPDSWTLE